ncbi:MAG: hypothetical protein WCI22_08855 [Actinomycetota bacterium]
MTSAPLVVYGANDPIWGFVAQLRAARFSGEAIVGVGPRVRVFARQGTIYLAEREGDAPLPSRLVAAGALTPEQLAKGVMLVDGSMSLAKLFVREPAVDRHAVELVVTQANDAVLSAVADDPVVTAELHPDHHHASGIHEWWPDSISNDSNDSNDSASQASTRVADGLASFTAPTVAPAEPIGLEQPPELMHLPDSTPLVEPLTVAPARPIEPIRIEPIRIACAHADEQLAASFAPPMHAEATLLAPPPLPPLVGLDEMSAFEDQFQLHLAPEPPIEPAAVEPAAVEPAPVATTLPTLAAGPVKHTPAPTTSTAAPSATSTTTSLPTTSLPTTALPTLGAVASWQPAERPANHLEPLADFDRRELPKLATTTKSMATISAEQAAAAAEQAAAAAEQASATTIRPDDALSSLPRFADIAGIAPSTAAVADPPPLEPNTARRRPAPIESLFETETLWTPPPADLTAAEIWHLVDEIVVEPAATPNPNDAVHGRSGRFHFGRRAGKVAKD